MRRVLLLAACLSVFATGAIAQDYFNLGTFIAYIDRADVGEPVTLRLVRLHGWGYDCATGQTGGVGIVIVDGAQVPAMFRFGLPRPDVALAHEGYCRTTPYAGLYAEFYATPGVHRVHGFFGTSGGAFFIDRTITVP